MSASVSSTLNIAHNKLKNPITRAAYLVGMSLWVHGKVKLLTGTDVLGEDENFKVPMVLLMEVMEIREQLSNAKSKEEKEALHKQVDASFKKHENAFRCSLCKSLYLVLALMRRGDGAALQRGCRDEILRQYPEGTQRKQSLVIYSTCLEQTRQCKYT